MKTNVGDWFEVKGYTLIATLTAFDGGGEAVILSNDSTHYLVAFRFDDRAALARLASTYYYSDDGTCKAAYLSAVDAAARLAVHNFHN